MVFFLACLLSLVSIALTFVVLSEMDGIGKEGGVERFWASLRAAVPLLIELITPIAVLLGTILTFTSLSKTSEATAMQAAGVSLGQMLKPILYCGLIIAGLSYLNQSHLAPAWGSDKKLGFGEVKPSTSLWRFYQGRLFYFTGLDQVQGGAQRAGILSFNSGHQLTQIQEIGGIQGTEEKWALGEGRLLKWEGEKIVFSQTPAQETRADHFPIIFTPELAYPKYSGFIQLGQEIKIKAEGAVNYQPDLYAFFQKLASLLAVFTMMALALPFSLFSGRQANAKTGIVVAVILGFVFWLFDQLFLSLFETGALPAWLAAFGSNLLFGGLALFLIRRKLG